MKLIDYSRILCTYILINLIYAAGKVRLNEDISHFELLNYDPHKTDSRSKRDINSDVNIKFHSHGRKFRLRLKRDVGSFSPNAVIERADGTSRSVSSLLSTSASSSKSADQWPLYTGVVLGHPGSSVDGVVDGNGLFTGALRLAHGETFYVERREMYEQDLQDSPATSAASSSKHGHSVIYSSNNVDTTRYKRDAKQGSCGNDENVKWMKEVQKRATHLKVTNPAEKYSHRRNKRSAVQDLTCSLRIQTDPVMWKYMTASRAEGGLNLGYDVAHVEITKIINTMVTGVNKIYENTNFHNDSLGSFNPISFVVHRIKIDKECAHENEHPLCADNLDSSNVLHLNSLKNHSAYCLAYVVTARDFVAGTLGLAWVGGASTSGGLCEKYRKYTSDNGDGQEQMKSLNTGLITLVNYGKRVALPVSTLTLAHEIGHNFGAQHDSNPQCRPYAQPNHDKSKGNYVMYSSATSGNLPNNIRFSTCSIQLITNTVHSVVNSLNGKTNCLIAMNNSYCGNMIVENKEECDCGYDTCNDMCCHKRTEQKNMCKLKTAANCSPSQGPCCMSSCNFMPDSQLCEGETECRYEIYCDGASSICPKLANSNKKDKFPCDSNTKICMQGECTSSICQRIGWNQCYITSEKKDLTIEERQNMCYVACENPLTNKCISTSDETQLNLNANIEMLNMLKDINVTSIQMQSGSPCNDYKGYCDTLLKCRSIDTTGPLARIRQLLLSEATLTSIRRWVVEYWYAVLLIAVGFVLLMAGFIQVCAVHTPTSNPNRKPARKITDTLHRRHRPPPRNPNFHEMRRH